MAAGRSGRKVLPSSIPLGPNAKLGSLDEILAVAAGSQGILAEVRAKQDKYEVQAVALRAVAVGRAG
jgi:hypothetical protein